MEEMLRFCDTRQTIRASTSRICVESAPPALVHLPGAYFLSDIFCNGYFHGGCELNCGLIWAEEWLSKVPVMDFSNQTMLTGYSGPRFARAFSKSNREILYSCQLTNIGALRCMSVEENFYSVIREFSESEFIAESGQGECESGFLGLKSGEKVRIRSESEIRRTLDERGKVRGLPFLLNMFSYCDSIHIVDSILTKVIDARSGRLRVVSPGFPLIRLTGIRCDGEKNDGCTRHSDLLWRETWLERV